VALEGSVMGLIREPKEVDFIIEPLEITEKDNLAFLVFIDISKTFSTFALSNKKENVSFQKNIVMPAISVFFGLIVYMYAKDNKKHHSPHIHVEYQDGEAIFSIPDGEILEKDSI